MSRRAIATLAAVAVTVLAGAVAASSPARAAGPLISQGRPVTASSVENGGTPATDAVDGNPAPAGRARSAIHSGSRSTSGQTAAVDQVILTWEAAYARAFQIQTSANGAAWTTIYSTTTGAGGTQTLAVSGSGRYVRMYGTARATGYGYSLWEFGVYGTIGGGPRPPGGTPISEFKPVAASSWEGGNAPAAALDGRTTTRWSSQFSDPQWIQVDLGGTATVSQVVLDWEAAYATRLPDRDVGQRHRLDHDLQHHHRDRRHADPRRHRHRPVRADVRHRPRHRLRLLAVGVPGVRHRRHVDDHAADALRPDPAAGARRASSPSPRPPTARW